MATPEENLYQAAASILAGSMAQDPRMNLSGGGHIIYAIELAKELATAVKKEPRFDNDPEPVEQKL